MITVYKPHDMNLEINIDLSYEKELDSKLCFDKLYPVKNITCHVVKKG